MRMLVLAALLITLPAIAVVVWSFSRPIMLLPALGSLSVGLLPFVVALLLMRSQKGREKDAGH
ncbi:MAG TPA: hypothetical protein VFI91_02130 [Longimicrobiaceae bacterium]|nr:hypothetical protein [Longimicrobiaceae bacterium]